MRIDDLRTLLDERADEVSAPDRAPHAEVGARIRRRARARMAGAVVAVVIAVVAAALVVPNLTSAGRPVTPAASTSPSASPTASVTPRDRAGFGSFPGRVDGDRLLRSYIVARGDTSETFTVKAPASGLRYFLHCLVPAGSTTVPVNDLLFQVTENGTTVGLVGCGTDLSTVPNSVGGVRSGTATIVIRLEDKGNLVADPLARLAVGVYERSGKTVTKAGITVPVVQGSPPDETTLRAFHTLTLTSNKRRLTARLPASTKPLRITYSASGDASVGVTHLAFDGTDLAAFQGAGMDTITVAAGPARDATITVDDKRADGTLALIIYVAT